MASTAPARRSTIPIVHSAGMLRTKPRISRITPKAIKASSSLVRGCPPLAGSASRFRSWVPRRGRVKRDLIDDRGPLIGLDRRSTRLGKTPVYAGPRRYTWQRRISDTETLIADQLQAAAGRLRAGCPLRSARAPTAHRGSSAVRVDAYRRPAVPPQRAAEEDGTGCEVGLALEVDVGRC